MKVTKVYAAGFFSKYPRFAERVNSFIETVDKTCVAQNMVLCVAITLCCSFFYFEEALLYMSFMRKFLLVMLFLTWFSMAFINGVKKKASFMFFFEIYWLVPFLIINWKSGLTILDYNVVLWNSARACDFLVVNSTKLLTDKINMDPFVFAMIFMLMLVVMYVCGYLVRVVFNSKAERLSASTDIPSKEEIPEKEKKVENVETKSEESTDYYVEQFLNEHSEPREK